MGRPLLSVLACFMFMGSLVAPAKADDTADCAKATGDAAIAACTRHIDAGGAKQDDLAAPYYHRGRALREKRDWDRAIADLDKAITIDPKMHVALLERGLTWWDKNDPDRAIADFGEAIRVKPDYVDAFFHRARIWNDVKRDYDRAIADDSEAIRLNPKFASAYNNRAIAYGNKGERDKAIADWTEVIKLDPKRTGAFFERARAWRGKRDWDHAIADYDEALKLDPKMHVALLERALSWWDKGDADKAIADLGEAIRVKPDYANAFFHRARVWNDSKRDFDRSIADGSEAIRLNPKFVLAFNNRAIAYGNKGERDKAIADWSEVIKLDPKAAGAYYNRGIHWRHKGDHDRAITDYGEAIKLNPKFAKAFLQRGISLAHKGDRDRAVADFDEAIKHDPKSAGAFNERGLLYERIGGLDRAVADFRAVLALDPNAKGAAERVQRVEQKIASLSAPAPAPAPAPTTPQIKLPPENRIALVIGNSAYANVGKLPNAKNDAEKIAATLKRLGFSQVTLALDLTRDKLNEALKAFAAQATRADWAMVYYAGHGMEFGGVNYLVPTDAKLASDRDISFEAVALDQVLFTVEGAKKLRLVVLDACRDNPFVKTMSHTSATRSVGRGLGQVEPEGATLVVYAAKHGQTALDGTGANSPFVSALAKYLETPRLEINLLFRKVRDDVFKGTGKRQEPFTYGSLPAEEFYFRRQ